MQPISLRPQPIEGPSGLEELVVGFVVAATSALHALRSTSRRRSLVALLLFLLLFLFILLLFSPLPVRPQPYRSSSCSSQLPACSSSFFVTIIFAITIAHGIASTHRSDERASKKSQQDDNEIVISIINRSDIVTITTILSTITIIIIAV